MPDSDTQFGGYIEAVQADLGGDLPTWTHDATGVTFQLPDDLPQEVYSARTSEDFDYAEWCVMACKAAIGDEGWEAVNADRMRPFGPKRQGDLVSSWMRQLGLTSAGKAEESSGPSPSTEPQSNATSPSTTESTPQASSTAA